MSHAIFAAAYLEELDGLCDELEKLGSGDPDFTSEKRAAFGYVMSQIEDDEDYAFIDKMASDELSPLEKIAIRAQLGKILAGVGARASRAGAALQRGAKAPSKAFTRRFTQKGWKPQRTQAVHSSYQKLGPRGWMRMRRATAPAFAGPSAAAGAAARGGAAHPISRMKWTGLEKMKGHKDIGLASMAGQEIKRRAQREAARKAGGKAKQVGKATASRARAGAEKGKKGKGKNGEGVWPSIRSGLMWGGGFGLGQRVLAPEEGPEYILGQN